MISNAYIRKEERNQRKKKKCKPKASGRKVIKLKDKFVKVKTEQQKRKINKT